MNIWAKPHTTGASAGRRHNIAGKSNRKWDVLSIENRKDLHGRTAMKQERREMCLQHHLKIGLQQSTKSRTSRTGCDCSVT